MGGPLPVTVIFGIRAECREEFTIQFRGSRENDAEGEEHSPMFDALRIINPEDINRRTASGCRAQ